MMRQIIKLAIVMCFLTSCYKKPECSGTVYSKHGIPMSGVGVILSETTDLKVPGNDMIAATTFRNGFYYFKFKMKHNHFYSIRCENDSGKALGGLIRDPKSNHIDLQLQ